MNNLIVEFKNVISTELCEDIIETYEHSNHIKDEYEIPKNNILWEKIEKLLYTVLLENLKNYKINCFIKGDKHSMNTYSKINRELYTKSFVIKKYNKQSDIVYKKEINKRNNRYIILYFLFYLNSSDKGGDVILFDDVYIKSETGKLAIFPDNKDCHIQLPISNDLYIITGELSYVIQN